MVRLGKLSDTEAVYQPLASYVRDIQTDGMTDAWRHKITTWFEQLAESFKMSTETVSVATNYLDRYLSCKSCGSLKFQLASIASIFLASKVEEARPFKTVEFEVLSDKVFNAADLRMMELELLCTLKWRLHPPTYHTFINLLLVLFDDDVKSELVEEHAFRLAERTRTEADFIKYPPSMIAVASILCALKQLGVKSSTVTKWMQRVHQCHLRYTLKADAARTITECGIKLIQLDGGHTVLLNSSVACDAEVEHATSASNAVMEAATDLSEEERKQAGSPTDVMEIEQIEKYGAAMSCNARVVHTV